MERPLHFCRDKGRGRVDAGALCLSSCGVHHPVGHHDTPTESYSNEDKHKTPTLPHIYLLPLMNINAQDRSGPVILSAAKNLPRHAEILRCAQNDSPDGDW